jgi:hypothetical protein
LVAPSSKGNALIAKYLEMLHLFSAGHQRQLAHGSGQVFAPHLHEDGRAGRGKLRLNVA